MKKITIAIDGYSSCGKSTMAKDLAKEIGYVYVDTGAMYRSVTLYALRHPLSRVRPLLIACLTIVCHHLAFYGPMSDVLHPVLCAAGYNLRWLLRAVARLGLKALFALWILVGICGRVVSDEGPWPPGRRLGGLN